jgi:hypothetical protein
VGESSNKRLAIAIIGLLTAALGVVSSPVWASPLCHAVGACKDSNAPSGGHDGNPLALGSLGKAPTVDPSVKTHPPTKPTTSGDGNGGGNGGTDTNTGGSQWSCPGGTFCAWDLPDARGEMIAEEGSTCRLYDIGSAGQGDRLSSFENRTGVAVGIYNWDGTNWIPLQTVQDGQEGNMPAEVDNVADAVKVCDS